MRERWFERIIPQKSGLNGSNHRIILKLKERTKPWAITMSTTLTAIIVVLLITWLWTDSLRARERAIKASAKACKQLEVQLLDQTVALSRLGLGRNPGGRLRIRRQYTFEFSTNGGDRHTGHITVLGDVLETIHLEHPDGNTII